MLPYPVVIYIHFSLMKRVFVTSQGKHYVTVFLLSSLFSLISMELIITIFILIMIQLYIYLEFLSIFVVLGIELKYFLRFIHFMFMNVLPACLCVHCVHAWCLHSWGDGIQFFGARVVSHPVGLGMKPCPLEEQALLFSAAPERKFLNRKRFFAFLQFLADFAFSFLHFPFCS